MGDRIDEIKAAERADAERHYQEKRRAIDAQNAAIREAAEAERANARTKIADAGDREREERNVTEI